MVVGGQGLLRPIVVQEAMPSGRQEGGQLLGGAERLEVPPPPDRLVAEGKGPFLVVLIVEVVDAPAVAFDVETLPARSVPAGEQMPARADDPHWVAQPPPHRDEQHRHGTARAVMGAVQQAVNEQVSRVAEIDVVLAIQVVADAEAVTQRRKDELHPQPGFGVIVMGRVPWIVQPVEVAGGLVADVPGPLLQRREASAGGEFLRAGQARRTQEVHQGNVNPAQILRWNAQQFLKRLRLLHADLLRCLK